MSFPELEWFDAQEESEVDLNVLQAKTAVALPKIVASEVGPGQTDLRELSEVEITLISDDEIAAAHGQFMDDPTPTDVITFQHGELLISADTAAREAVERDWPIERELLLYTIHGLLHLHGYLDADSEEREQMHNRQNAIIDEVWPV